VCFPVPVSFGDGRSAIISSLGNLEGESRVSHDLRSHDELYLFYPVSHTLAQSSSGRFSPNIYRGAFGSPIRRYEYYERIFGRIEGTTTFRFVLARSHSYNGRLYVFEVYQMKSTRQV